MYNDRRYSLARYSVNQEGRVVEIADEFSETMGGIVRVRNYWGRKGRYSLLRYSVNPAKKTIMISEIFSEAVNAVVGPAIPVDFREKYSDTMQGSAQGTISVISAFSTAEELFTIASMSADVITAESLSEDLRCSTYGQKNTPAMLAVRDELAAKARALKNTPAEMELASVLTASAAGSKNIPASLKASVILTSILEATSQTTERTTIQLTIPPGGELRIDSELFLALLNGENVLHTQSGDWINVSRNLLRLIVESASGGQLDGQLIYTERYL